MQLWIPDPTVRADGEFAVRLNPGQPHRGPFAIIDLSESGTTALVIHSAEECDRLIAAATRAKSLLSTPPPAEGEGR